MPRGVTYADLLPKLDCARAEANRRRVEAERYKAEADRLRNVLACVAKELDCRASRLVRSDLEDLHAIVRRGLQAPGADGQKALATSGLTANGSCPAFAPSTRLAPGVSSDRIAAEVKATATAAMLRLRHRVEQLERSEAQLKKECLQFRLAALAVKPSSPAGESVSAMTASVLGATEAPLQPTSAPSGKSCGFATVNGFDGIKPVLSSSRGSEPLLQTLLRSPRGSAGESLLRSPRIPVVQARVLMGGGGHHRASTSAAVPLGSLSDGSEGSMPNSPVQTRRSISSFVADGLHSEEQKRLSPSPSTL